PRLASPFVLVLVSRTRSTGILPSRATWASALGGLTASNRRVFWIVHVALSATVSVMRTHLAVAPPSAIRVDVPLPCPSATGALQVVPSWESSTLYPRG